MIMLKLFIEVNKSFIGYHRWKEASDHRKYLSYYHRHRFDISVAVRVLNKNRSIEFHDLSDMITKIVSDYRTNSLSDKEWVEFEELTGRKKNTNPLVINSCEDFAMHIVLELHPIIKSEWIQVKVSEDGDYSGYAEVQR